jgi:heme-degrading monooxygenase HmoA
MFIVIYRWRLRAGSGEQFARAWRTITDLAIDHCGSGGSCLSQGADGTWIAIARWESREARSRCFARGLVSAEVRQRMEEAIVETLPPLELTVIDDRWVALR